jgi:hypothetical protein
MVPYKFIGAAFADWRPNDERVFCFLSQLGYFMREIGLLAYTKDFE